MARCSILLFSCYLTKLMIILPLICSWISNVNSEQSNHIYEPISVGAYDGYASVWISSFNIPEAATQLEWSFIGLQSDPRCPLRNMHVSLQASGFPVISPEGDSFPDHFHLAGSAINISLTSNGSQILHTMPEPPSGLWFLAAYRDGIDEVVKKVTSLSCDYTIAYNITMTTLSDMDELPVTMDGTPVELTLSKRTMIYRFKTSERTWSSVLQIKNCTTNGTNLDPCPLSVLARANALPTEEHADVSVDCVNATEEGVCDVETAAVVNAYTYVRLHRTTEEPLSLQLVVANRECGLMDTPPPSPTIADDIPCPNIRKMVRIVGGSQPYEVVYALNATEMMLVENIAKVMDNFARIFQFEVVPTVDSGGTLRLRAEFNNTFENHTDHIVNVSLCLKLGRIPVYGMNVSCDPSDMMTLTSAHNASDEMVVRYDPYPRAGIWYLVMQSLCYTEDPQKGIIIVPCGFGEVSVRFDVIVTACVDGGCSGDGTCSKYLSGTLLYSACKCEAGLRGYGCTDTSHAYPPSEQLTFTLLLTMSNLFFLPAIIMATYKQYYVEALVYFFNMFFSSFYHACDMSQWSTYILCIMPYNVLSFCDFFCSVLSIWVTLIAMATLKPPLAQLAHTFGMVTLAMGVEWDRHNFLVNAMPAIVGLIIVAVSWSVRCRRRKECYPSRSQWLKMIPGFLLAGTGIAIFGLVETDQNYPYTHSVWHVVMALSILCLLPSQQRRYSGNFLSLESSNDSLMEELGQPVEVVGLMTANSRMTQAASTSMDNDDVVLLD